MEVVLLVMLGTSLIFAVLIGYSYINSRDIVLAGCEQSARNLAIAAAREMDLELRTVARITDKCASVVENACPNHLALLTLIRQLVETQRGFFGSTIAFEPFGFSPDIKAFAPYYCKGKNGIEFVQLGTETYNYFAQDWYKKPKELRKPVWSAPYFDEGGGNVLMVTYSSPFFKLAEDGSREEFAGVITGDVSVKWLTKELSSIKVAQTGYCFLISQDGTFLVHPQRDLILTESMFTLADKYKSPQLKEAGQLMLENKSGFVDVEDAFGGPESFLAFARLSMIGWSLGLVFPRNELLAEVNRLHRTNVLLAVAGIVMLLIVSLLVAQSIARPLRRIADATTKVAAGELDLDLPDMQRNDEVGRLSRAFVRMSVNLKRYIRELTETTAAKERIESELAVAARIQQSMLPSSFPAFPDRDDFDIYAVMRPAKEVGGDFYDFFLLDDDHLCVTVGDVSGKGVPAALFMSVTKYLVAAAVDVIKPLEEVFSRVNNHLARNNESCMFVTIFVGILNLKTGELIYVNAAHNPPLIQQPELEATFLGPPGGPVLGVVDGAEFKTERLFLQPGGLLLIYTDGVTEAFNKSDEAFSEERLLAASSSFRGKSAKQVADILLQEVSSFADGALQADDITAVALIFKPK